MESIELQGTLSGHYGWVTCIANAHDDPDTILSGSRDKSVLVWNLERIPDPNNPNRIKTVKGKMKRRLTGHNHFISDLAVSVDRQYAISSSWDGDLRLWNLNTGDTHQRFKGHTKDVLSVAFSADNRQIVSGGRDRTVKVWNTVGANKATLTSNESGHRDWVTCARFSPNAEDPVIVTCGRDKRVKVWKRDSSDNSESITLRHDLKGHTKYVNSVTVSPDGSLCASGGKDGIAHLWDLNEGKPLSSLEANGEITCLTFSPNRYWLCGAVGTEIKIWDLETKDEVGVLAMEKPEEPQQQARRGGKTKKQKQKSKLPNNCTCICWSQDGKTLYAGYTDGKIRVWSLISSQE